MTTALALPVPSELAQKAKPAKSIAECGPHVVMEPKLDGWRLLVGIDEAGARLYTYSGNELTGSLPAIEAELAAALPPGTWLDTEAVAFTVQNDEIRHEWGRVQSILGSGTAKAAAQSDDITLMAFDLIAHGGIDARPLPFERRRALLVQLMEHHCFKAVAVVPQLDANEDEYDLLIAQGFEGAMVKSLSAPYASGKRGAGWFKLKATHTDDVIVTGFKDGESGFAGYVGAVEFAQFRDGILTPRGRCSGMDWKTRVSMTKDPEKWIGKVIEVAHFPALAKDGAWRSPRFKRLRKDKDPASCGWTE